MLLGFPFSISLPNTFSLLLSSFLTWISGINKHALHAHCYVFVPGVPKNVYTFKMLPMYYFSKLN